MATIHALMEYETAGDPITGLKWTRKTAEKIADELEGLGIFVSSNTVGRLLKEMDFSLRVNHKKISGDAGPDRNEQFEYIREQCEHAKGEGLPIISVDTKKKELVGQFKNPGVAWTQEPIWVNDHDFRSAAVGIAVPYGIYDLQVNRGSLFVGTSYDTAQFAVESIEKWWRAEGRKHYPNAGDLLILADGGGGNGFRSRLWKSAIQEQLCDRHGLSVTVVHYPPGTSKWNPIEHRLFSEISKNWAGIPLDSYETVLKYARTTTTSGGLKVTSRLVRKKYKKGIRISDERMQQLNIANHDTLPKWNYTLYPTENGNSSSI